MKFSVKTVLVAFAGIWFQVYAAEVDIETCSDWETAVEATLTEDTTANIINRNDYFFGEDCGNGTFKTFEVKNNELTVVAPTIYDSDGPTFWDIRFEVTDGGAMIFATDVEFEFTTEDENDLEVYGGFFHVGEGSAARFMNNLYVADYGTTSVTDSDSDFTNDMWNGGCLWNNGSFIVDGVTTFEACFIIGGGESSPGKGGAIFNDVNGYVGFDGGVNIADTFLTDRFDGFLCVHIDTFARNDSPRIATMKDDEGNSGAGVYNRGKIIVAGDSTFQDLRADTDNKAGGAIYNGEGATFKFKNKAAATFIDTAAEDGGGVYNAGNFRFSGPALFVQSRGSAIFNVSPGNMKLSTGSVFWANSGSNNNGGAVNNEAGAILDIADDISFVGNSGDLCDDIYLEEDKSDSGVDDESLGYKCYP